MARPVRQDWTPQALDVQERILEMRVANLREGIRTARAKHSAALRELRQFRKAREALAHAS